jgi:SAM-dependent methyltransferase
VAFVPVRIRRIQSVFEQADFKMMNWQDFWNTDTPIYVNPRHKILHYKLIAEDFLTLIPSGPLRIMDYGSGEALNAQILLHKGAGQIILCDSAERVRQGLKERLKNSPFFKIITPDEAAALPNQSLDVIYAHSIVQYIKKEELQALLSQSHRQLKQGGMLILSDVIHPHSSALTDALALLQFAGKGGFLTAAITGLIKTAFSNYRTLRQNLGLSTYQEQDIHSLLETSGFQAQRLPHNPGHNQNRMAFVGMKA